VDDQAGLHTVSLCGGWEKMLLIVGLGNPGREYEHTRHNVGFKVIDELAKRWQISSVQVKFKGLLAEHRAFGTKILLLKPLTYMNLSGESIRQVMDFYKLNAGQLLIIYDDLDTPTGEIRLRLKGSSGGHNGIKSIIQHVGTEEFSRIRVGIGRPPQGVKVVQYVLENFHNDELGPVQDAIERSAEAVGKALQLPFDQVMTQFN
jgi:PTH1 family peptidyl-tRNA hydrolase